MINRILKFKNLYKILIFIPLIFYFGKRSYIAFDEGFYALQARWILDKGNWIIPLWWDEYVLDRTIGLQFLIAKSQAIFGRNIFSAYLPTTAAAILMLFIMLSKFASGSQVQQDNLLIQLGACIIFPTLLFFDKES